MFLYVDVALSRKKVETLKAQLFFYIANQRLQSVLEKV
jgi:hypothetical protein